MMKSQIFTVQLDYGSDMQQEIFAEIMQTTLRAIEISMRQSHKKNQINWTIDDINWVEGIYEGVMKYRIYTGISMQDFYDYNQKHIDKHIKTYKTSLTNIYTDIVCYD